MRGFNEDVDSVADFDPCDRAVFILNRTGNSDFAEEVGRAVDRDFGPYGAREFENSGHYAGEVRLPFVDP